MSIKLKNFKSEQYWTKNAYNKKAKKAFFKLFYLICHWVFVTLINPFRIQNIKDLWLQLIGLFEDAISFQKNPLNNLIKLSDHYIRNDDILSAGQVLDIAKTEFPKNSDIHFRRSEVATFLEGNQNKLSKELFEGIDKALFNMHFNKLENANIRFLGNDFGGMHATILDPLIKLNILGVTNITYIMILSEDYVINKNFIDCWKKYILIIYTNKKNYLSINRLLNSLFLNINIFNFGEKNLLLYQAHNIALKEWKNKPSLISSQSIDISHGQQALKEIGMGPNDWFVALHVREGSKGGIDRNGADADIMTYSKAISEITKLGGWVIRVGIGGTPLPPMDRVWDYANSSLQSRKLDVFMWSACKFFIGTCSGPVCCAATFGVPTLITNSVMIGSSLKYYRSYTLPKLFWSKSKNRLLTFKEIFDGPYAWTVRSTYDEGDVVLRPNTPEEIRLAVIEMLQLVSAPEGIEVRTPNQELFEVSRNQFTDTSCAWVSNSFLTAHSALLY